MRRVMEEGGWERRERREILYTSNVCSKRVAESPKQQVETSPARLRRAAFCSKQMESSTSSSEQSAQLPVMKVVFSEHCKHIFQLSCKKTFIPVLGRFPFLAAFYHVVGPTISYMKLRTGGLQSTKCFSPRERYREALLPCL